MSNVITYSHTFAPLAGPLPLSYLDDNFTNVSAALASLNTFSNYYVDSGSANAYAITTAAGQTFTLTAGLSVQVLVSNTNNAASTLSINGGAAKSIKSPDGNALSSGELFAGGVYSLIYNGTDWVNLSLWSAVGTWLPSVGGSATYTGQSGNWVKIGRAMTIWGYMEINSIGTGSTSTISGLPYPATGTFAGVANYFAGLNTNMLQVNLFTSTSSLRNSGNTAAAAAMTLDNAIYKNGTRIDFSLSYMATT